jgi:hypothetical protein
VSHRACGAHSLDRPVLAAMWPLPLDRLTGAGAPRLPEAPPAVLLPVGLDWRVGTAAQLTESGRA